MATVISKTAKSKVPRTPRPKKAAVSKCPLCAKYGHRFNAETVAALEDVKARRDLKTSATVAELFQELRVGRR